jgi:hypothetical protein
MEMHLLNQLRDIIFSFLFSHYLNSYTVLNTSQETPLLVRQLLRQLGEEVEEVDVTSSHGALVNVI